jgi:hypothetical protein
MQLDYPGLYERELQQSARLRARLCAAEGRLRYQQGPSADSTATGTCGCIPLIAIRRVVSECHAHAAGLLSISCRRLMIAVLANDALWARLAEEMVPGISSFLGARDAMACRHFCRRRRELVWHERELGKRGPPEGKASTYTHEAYQALMRELSLAGTEVHSKIQQVQRMLCERELSRSNPNRQRCSTPLSAHLMSLEILCNGRVLARQALALQSALVTDASQLPDRIASRLLRSRAALLEPTFSGSISRAETLALVNAAEDYAFIEARVFLTRLPLAETVQIASLYLAGAGSLLVSDEHVPSQRLPLEVLAQCTHQPMPHVLWADRSEQEWNAFFHAGGMRMPSEIACLVLVDLEGADAAHTTVCFKYRDPPYPASPLPAGHPHWQPALTADVTEQRLLLHFDSFGWA